MTRPYFRALPGVIALVMLAPVVAAGQNAPRTAWGDPDLQGTYTNKTITPLERPESLGDKEFLTDEEVALQEQGRLDRNEELLYAPPRRTVAGGNVGGYNNFWLDGGTRPTGRTSLIFNPPNGRMPPRTADGAARKTAHDAAFPVAGPFASWEDLELNDRCLVWSAGPPMLPSAYNNNFMIMQTPGYVAVHIEMIHDTRIIPIDGRDHVPTGIRQWHGDARGRWEGNTLVVETTNLPGAPRRTRPPSAATRCCFVRRTVGPTTPSPSPSGSRGSRPTPCTTSSRSTTRPSGPGPGRASSRSWRCRPRSCCTNTPVTRGTTA